MSVMENTLLRTAQNEGHVCPNPERSEVEEQNYTPRLLEW